jgi:hypothetical protein
MGLKKCIWSQRRNHAQLCAMFKGVSPRDFEQISMQGVSASAGAAFPQVPHDGIALGAELNGETNSRCDQKSASRSREGTA